ncbi:unnamed protein product [Darwinula stevensoni]|uniref:Uncharacterized protein n=1 Tax=Darwinula stevensoni TaxID=69355 RepID=A0A7R9ACQ5_9CRUS|nr:unnamed protein product [Darwinula stevensoni]CAG0900390.1 unnamed protein product [Darwinula stevensoni]
MSLRDLAAQHFKGSPVQTSSPNGMTQDSLHRSEEKNPAPQNESLWRLPTFSNLPLGESQNSGRLQSEDSVKPEVAGFSLWNLAERHLTSGDNAEKASSSVKEFGIPAIIHKNDHTNKGVVSTGKTPEEMAPSQEDTNLEEGPNADISADALRSDSPEIDLTQALKQVAGLPSTPSQQKQGGGERQKRKKNRTKQQFVELVIPQSTISPEKLLQFKCEKPSRLGYIICRASDERESRTNGPVAKTTIPMRTPVMFTKETWQAISSSFGEVVGPPTPEICSFTFNTPSPDEVPAYSERRVVGLISRQEPNKGKKQPKEFDVGPSSSATLMDIFSSDFRKFCFLRKNCDDD